MFSNLDTQSKLMIGGNVFLIACCVFYLLWWALAFHPTGAIKGFRSGWLLIPAAVCGLVAVIQIIRGGCDGSIAMPFPRWAILVGGIVVYVVLLVGTYALLKRQVTTELFLIIGSPALMFLELGAFHGLGRLTTTTMIVLLVITVVVAVVSLVCYLMYYDLDAVRGYVDGMVPLILIAAMMAVVTVVIAVTADAGGSVAR